MNLSLQVFKPFSQSNALLVVVFLYFITLSGDLLEMSIGSFTFKISRFFGGALFFLLLLSNRFRLIERRFYYCFLAVLSSFLLSACFSYAVKRTLAGCIAGIFTYVCFFLVPLNLMFIFDHKKILRLYFLSFFLVGMHAFIQVLLSLFGIADPFAAQYIGATILVARGHSWAYEPSYYALFAIPFVVYLNTRFLLSSRQDVERISLWKVVTANFLLLISTSTGGFFSYFIFCVVGFILAFFFYVKKAFPDFRKKIIKFLLCTLFFSTCFAFLLMEVFLHTFLKFFHLGLLTHWSFMLRWEKIVDCWKLFCQSPLFGNGLRSIEHYLYLDAHFLDPSVGLQGPFDGRDLYCNFTSSNVFMEVLASLGIYGLATFYLLGILVWQMFTSMLKEGRLPLEEKKNVFALFVSVIVMMICLQFNQEIFRNYIWVHMGISIGYLLRMRSAIAAPILTHSKCYTEIT